MSLLPDFHDPLAICLKHQVSVFLSNTPLGLPHVSSLHPSSSRGEILRVLSQLLLVPSITSAVARAFRPLLLDLCARWLENEEGIEEKLVSLCFLLQPHVEIYPILSAFLQQHIPQNGPLAFVLASSSPQSLDTSRLQRVLLAYYRILQANRELPEHLSWSLEPLSKLLWAPHPDPGVRYLAVRCYSLQSRMGEAEREKLEKELVGSDSDIDCPVEFGEDADGQRRLVDGWLLPIIEAKRVHEARSTIASDQQNFFEGPEESRIELSELSKFVTSVHGILMFSRPIPGRISTPLIPTPTSVQALRALALHVSLRLPVLLTSPPSSGKSLLLSHLAAALHPEVKNQIITIGLADTSLDPRSLLGSYVSSPTSPGTFEWKEGILVRALRMGRWVVFEDIDRGSNEVLGTIKPLIESLGADKWVGGRAKMQIPSRGEVVAAESFMIFATRSPMPPRNGVFAKPSFFGAHKFHEVTFATPTTEELRTILVAKFPRLGHAAVESLIRLWDAIKALGSAASSRDVGLRELEKYCRRVEGLLPTSYQPMDIDIPTNVDQGADSALAVVFSNPTLREDMYTEARDIFFGSGTLTAAARARADAVAAVVAEHLSLSQEQCEWVLRGRVPEFDNERDVNGRTTALRIGRIRLPARASKMEISPPATRPFALHRPAVLLMSRIATAISLCEPVLLTGETGTGKTSVVTHMATALRRPLISLNLSQQTESSDLIGGFKPVDARVPGSELQERFLELFRATFSQKKNAKFEESVLKAVQEVKWKRAVGLWKESARLAKERIQGKLKEMTAAGASQDELDSDAPRKRRRTEQVDLTTSEANWTAFEQAVHQFELQHVKGKGKFAFSFVEGPLVKALRSGDWVLLDEINLASPETLEAISSLLHGPTASITLTEQGSLEPVPRHPDFRLFACMNPATDVGKKDLPPNIRSHFTEIDVPPPDADRDTLLAIVTQYIGPSAVGDKAAIMDVAEFYTAVKQLAEDRKIADGANHKPHFSMRTLARALTFAADIASSYSLRRAMWEGCLMAFTMVLDAGSAELVTALAQKHILSGVRNPRALLARDPAPPQSRPEDFVKFGPFYLERGHLPEDSTDDYIMTPSVEKKLIDLARIIITRRFPVLIEGPTSSGKTSSIEYLAKRTGHRFVRINNHEHTDIQEYLGTYVSDPVTGKLVFRDGLLVQALRNGDWIVLDELNLAPTDVLEALNRLLDDNRELVIPETQEVVTPHPHFMLFATQNPPGLYAGRKILSRAFRNRFLEVHFEDVPQTELESILCQRCRIAPSYAQRIVAVFRELQTRRQSSRVFESKHGFATLRDLFRWAGRDAVGYQELAENGYMLLAERARREDDKVVVKEIIESIMKVRIDESALYDFSRIGGDFATQLGFDIPSSTSLVWTKAMQRLLVLVGRALLFNEPVLLVGETGSGKTSVCQVYADAAGKRLYAVNCHQNTETADLIGGLRPMRNRNALEAEILQEATSLLAQHGVSDVPRDAASLSSSLKGLEKLIPALAEQVQAIRLKLQRLGAIFEWHDGPLVEAMRQGDVLLLDEISLADDSVLERLNSVLEPARTVVLAEKGGDDVIDAQVQAAPGFKLVSTMNPGGDYGKKELSPALRNRFTEIWVPSVDDRADLEQIVVHSWRHECLKMYTVPLLDFCDWLSSRTSERSLFGLRDILAWVAFSNAVLDSEAMHLMPSNEIFHHAARMTCIDGLGSFPQLSAYSTDALQRLKADALSKLHDIAPVTPEESAYVPSHHSSHFVQLGVFAIPRGPQEQSMHTYNIQAPTTRDNAMRVVRACQLYKPILLEGSPGVGKTSLITALANICGYHLCRINLSDQTDLADLFGSDLPVEGGGPGEFAWKDAEFLKAMQEGHWVLLDEMNLAPQSVLEGLNAVLDHRGSVYVPELGRSFSRHPAFRIFAAQNPIQQGGGRKGLPKSYVNRFTKVYIDPLTPSDLLQITRHLFPHYPAELLQSMINFNTRLEEEVTVKRAFGRAGSPWEFNLRDLVRWGALLQTPDSRPLHPIEHLRNIYLSRFRTASDRASARILFDSVFNVSSDHLNQAPYPLITASHVQVGHFFGSRANFSNLSRCGVVLQSQLLWIEAMGVALQQAGLVILTGPHGSGKTSIVRLLAHLTGHPLHEVSVNNTTDTADILGSFEQVDSSARLTKLIRRLIDIVERRACSLDGSRSQFTSALAELKIAADAGSTPSSSGSLATVLHFLDELPVDVNGSVHEQTDVCNEIRQELSTSVAVGRFEWVDGPLVRALKAGHWLLLDGANLCSPSVLDRLNALCEPSGVLTLNERGLVNGAVQVIVPHPSFRLIMSVDSQHGELSRAMRNRGIEVCLSAERDAEDVHRMQDHVRLPRVSATATRLVNPMSHIEFELQRRGLFVTTADLEHQSVSSDLRLNEDSLSSSMMNLSSVMLCSETSSDVISHFTARSVTPAYVHRLSRFLAERYLLSGGLNGLRPLVDSMTHGGVWDKLRRLRQQFGLMWPLSPDLLHFQPMDFFMKSLSYSNSYPELDRTSVQYPILRALEIFVKTCVYDHSERLSIRSIGAETSASDISSRVSKGVEDVIVQIGRLATAMLESLPDVLSDDLSVEIGVMLRLQKISQLMRDVSPDAVDFSTIQAVTGWMHDDLHNAPVRFSDLSFSVEVLSRLVAPSSGLGLTNIWLTLSNPRHMTRPVDFLELEKASTRQNLDGNRAHRLRMEMLQMMALQSLPDSANNKEAIEQLVEEVKNRLPDNNSSQHSVPASGLKDDVVSVLKELGIIARVHITNERKFCQDIERVIDLACQSPHVPLGRFVSYRHATWIMDADRFDLAALSPVHKSWFQSIWNLDSADGPSLLFQPTELYRTLLKGDWTYVTLASLDEYETELRRHSTLLMMYDASSSRTQSLIHMFRQALLILSFCFLDTFDEATRHEIVSSYAQPPDNPSHSLPDILEAIERTSHPQLALSVKRYLTAAVLQLDIHSSQSSIIGVIGQCWVALFHLFVDLYVPDTPLDPAAVQRCIWDFWTSERTGLMAQRKLHSQLEHRVTGNTVNGVVRYLDGQIQESAKHLDSFPEIAPGAKRSVLRLGQFWSEVSQFLTKVVAPSRLDPLINLLHLRDPSAPTREVVVQESISGFSQRLESVYQDFSDMSIPLQSALLHLRLGLRLIAHASQCQHSESLGAKADVLVAFPSVRATGTLLQTDSNDGGFGMGASAIDSLLLRLAAVAVEVDLGVDIRAHVHKIDVIYEQVTRLWLIDRSRQEEADKSSQSLYRSSRVDNEAVKDSDVEEEEFLFLFPDFDGSLETEQDVGSSGQRSSTHLIEVPHVNRLADLHLRLLGTQDHATLGQEATAAFTHHRTSLLRAVLDEHLKALPESLDAKSFIHQFSLLHRRQLHLQQQAQSTSRPYNFYLDAHVPEIRKASALVGLIKHRLEGILREWPDQMVLHHLKDRCDQILRLNVHSPVAKVLTALEQLLLQSEDWEMYANRDNSLKDQRQSLTSLIVDWRRLELASWKGLLQTQLIAFEEDVSEWWFRLYNAAVRGLLDVLAKEENSDDHDGVDIYLDSLVPLVDDYIQTSPIGQFSRRMELLQSFGTLIRHLATTKTLRERDALQRVLRIFHNTHAYYTQFIARIAGSLSSQRNTVEKEIQGFIKLASWRDINVQALKASAQRTHRQLYRSIRKFREILRQPAKGLLQPEQASQSEVASVTVHAMPQQEEYAGGDDVDQFPNYAVCSDGPAHLQDLPRTYRRFDTLLTTRVENFIRSRPSHSVDDLSSEILSTAKALSNISLPSATTAERREKHWKSLLVRKRKAWSDLLKELKRVGYAANVKPDVLARQRSDRWMREQSMLFLPSPAFTEVPKIEHYFHRLQGLFPQLRAALSDHHADLSTRELQRGVMFLESGLSIVLNARSRLASSFDSYQKLKDISQRLKSLRGLDQIAGRGPQALERASRVEGVLSRFSCALSETLEKLKILGELPSAPPTPFSVLQEVQAMLASSEGHRDRLRAVCLDLKRTSTPMLFQDEQAVLTAGEAFIVEASERLLVMADTQTHTEKIITSLQDWLVSEHLPGPTEPEILLSSTIDTDNTIDVLLVTVQSLLSVLPESEDLQQLSSQDNYIKSTSSTMSRLCDLLDIGAMAEKMDSAVEQLSLCSPESFQRNTSRLLPFVERYTRLVEAHLSGLARWTLSLLKLEFVVCSVVNNVAMHGFCKPPDAEEAGKGEGGEAAEGMGLGEGTGNENVSKEIEDESQVEGLKGEEGENNKEREKGADDDNAIEMGDDFEGDMEDVPEEGSEGEQESDEEGEEGPEEQIGDLDASDPSAVDEKLWGDEKGPETEAEESKTNEDRSTEAKQDSEVVAKEKQQSGERKDQTERPDEDETLTEDPVDEPMPEDGPEAAGETAPDGEGAPMDDHVQDANTLDLPDDLELGAGEETQDDQAANEDEDMLSEEELQEGDEAEQRPGSSPEPMDDQADDLDPQAHQAEGGDEEAANGGDDAAEDAAAEPDLQPADASSKDAVPEESYNSNTREDAAGESGQAKGGVTGAAGQGDDAEHDDGGVQDVQREAGAPDDAEGRGSNAAGVQSGTAPSQESHQRELSSNPLRSLGDTLKEIRQRFDDILEADSSAEQPVPHAADVAEPSQLEYLRPDDVDQGMQALGPAGAEQVAKLSDLKLVDDQLEGEDADAMDVDKPEPPTPRMDPPQTTSLHAPDTAELLGEDVEGAIAQHQVKLQDALRGAYPTAESNVPKAEIDIDVPEDPEQVEAALRLWQSQGQPLEGAENIWRLYESLTHDLSYALCEQLRLILEPTLATRLKGDYRTGKRLNMKKIIPYIASEYTKDKIWLRRTRPSQREYQVLIALDDSRSMAESHSVHLAHQTLALVAKALSRLEVGDIAIAKFGAGVDVLHAFDGGAFTDQAGVRVMQAFGFDQRATNVLAMVEASLRILEEARERRALGSSSAADLWQLEIIISDGICQDHEKLRTVLRKAEEQRVMVVFIVIDSLHSSAAAAATNPATTAGPSAQNSILSMNQVAYKNVDGRMELQMQRYLDSFPFEYYVVLRNVEALPEVLSGTLKQFFERISDE